MKKKQYILFAALLVGTAGILTAPASSFSNAQISNSRTMKGAAEAPTEPTEIQNRITCDVGQINESFTSARIRLDFNMVEVEKSIEDTEEDFWIENIPGYTELDAEGKKAAKVKYNRDAWKTFIPDFDTLTEEQKTEAITTEKEKEFSIGYENKKDNSEKIAGVLVYSVKKVDKTIEKRYVDIQTNNENLGFNVMSYSGGGDNYTQLYTEVALNPGEELIYDEWKIQNVFDVYRDSSDNLWKRKIDSNGNVISSIILAKQNTGLHGEDIFEYEKAIDTEYIGYSKFSGRTYISFNFKTLVNPEFYKARLTGRDVIKYKREWEPKIETGEYIIITKIGFQVNASLYGINNEGKIESVGILEECDPNLQESFIELNKEFQRLTFVNKSNKFDFENYKSVYLSNMTIELSIMKVEKLKNSPVSGTKKQFNMPSINLAIDDISYQNGNETVVIKKGNSDASFVDGNLVLLIPTLVYIAIYTSVSLGVYFYLKKKYAEDVFRRVRTKPYWSNNLMGLVGTTSLLISIISVVLRNTVLLSSLPVSNAIDPIIVVFSVTALIFCGYFVKYFSVQIKNWRENKRNAKLHIGEGQADDGTISIKSGK